MSYDDMFVEDPYPKPEWARIAIDSSVDTTAVLQRTCDLLKSEKVEQIDLLLLLASLNQSMLSLGTAISTLALKLREQEIAK